MKSIFFLMKYPTCMPETLKYKFNGQMNACVQLGYEVCYLEWDGEAFRLACLNTGERRHVMNTSQQLPRDKYYHTLYFVDMYRAAIKALGMRGFDFMYIRFLPTFPPAAALMKLAKKKGVTLIQELPTFRGKGNDDGGTQPSFARRVVLKLSNAYARLAQQNMDLFTVIGADAGGTLYGRPAMNINNGIDVSAIPVRKAQPQKDGLHFLLLANIGDRHGYDRMIDALIRYRGDQTIFLHFAGTDGDGSLAKWQKLAEDGGVGDRMIIHGGVYGEDLDRLIDRMDLGVSVLGFYRIGLQSGTALKGREYMARGLPFVYAGEDPTIAEDDPYALQVPNDATPIDMEEVVDFVLGLRGKPGVEQAMREYACRHMTWEVEFERILNAVDGGMSK